MVQSLGNNLMVKQFVTFILKTLKKKQSLPDISIRFIIMGKDSPIIKLLLNRYNDLIMTNNNNN